MRAAPEPDWSLGACTRHPSPDWWTASHPAVREAARHVCAGCTILAQCAAWAIALPVAETAVYGGMSTAERRRRHRAERDREAALSEARRAAGRRSEARRRQAGKAPTTKARYASGEAAMFKASAASYYAQHAEEVKARRRARHERDKDAINARRRADYAAARRSAAA